MNKKNASLQFAKFIATVDQLSASGKAVVNEMIDDPHDDMEGLANMINGFSELAQMREQSIEASQLRTMAKFALVGIGSILKAICEDELAVGGEHD